VSVGDISRSIYLPPWRVDVVVRSGTKLILPASHVARVVASALDSAGAPRPGSVTVVLTDNAELSELNAEHVGAEGPTDVLSFPMLPPESFRNSEATVTERVGGTSRTHIGDIAISVERAIEQAEQGRGGQTGDVKWSTADEMRLLVTHGTLHLCGWDHAEPSEESRMRALERRLLGEQST
jgi:probable rRNA maturation factor